MRQRERQVRKGNKLGKEQEEGQVGKGNERQGKWRRKKIYIRGQFGEWIKGRKAEESKLEKALSKGSQ